MNNNLRIYVPNEVDYGARPKNTPVLAVIVETSDREFVLNEKTYNRQEAQIVIFQSTGVDIRKGVPFKEGALEGESYLEPVTDASSEALKLAQSINAAFTNLQATVSNLQSGHSDLLVKYNAAIARLEDLDSGHQSLLAKYNQAIVRIEKLEGTPAA